jgi:ATP/ADP translocase
MKLTKLLGLAAVRLLGWAISAGITVVIAAIASLVFMSAVVTVATVFGLTPPYKAISGAAALTALVLAAVFTTAGRRNGKIRR